VTIARVKEILWAEGEPALADACRAGRQWAIASAMAGELRRLARHVESAAFAAHPPCEWSAQIVGAVILGNKANSEQIANFWRRTLGEGHPADAEIACFAYDAIAVWGGTTLADPGIAAKTSDLPVMKIAMLQHAHRAQLLAAEFARHMRFVRS
jgi:hypothetical protein